MGIPRFIFSERPAPRLARHVCFWALSFLYILYFSTHGGTGDLSAAGSLALRATELLLVFFLAIPLTYLFMYLLLPRFFTTGKRALFLFWSLLAFLLTEALLYLIYLATVYWVHPLFFGSPLLITHENWGKIFLNPLLMRILPLGAAAITIKYLKSSWQNEKELERLEKENLRMELKWLKAQLDPRFLLDAISGINELARQSSPEAPRRILHLSGLLKYLLYESDTGKVALSREIQCIQDFLALCRGSAGSGPDISLNASCEPSSLQVTPLLLFLLVRRSCEISAAPDLAHKWVTIDIRANPHHLHLKIVHSVSTGAETGLWENEPVFAFTEKRLEEDYPHAFELRSRTENEMSMVSLRLSLDGTPLVKKEKIVPGHD